MSLISESAQNRMFSIGLWAWLEIIEKEKNRLSDGGQVALELLREDLEKLSIPSD